MYLGTRQSGLVTIQEIATAHGISKNHLTKVVHRLGLLDLVQTIRGRAGGIRLGKLPEDIRLGSIVRLTERNFHMVECFDEVHNLCSLSSTCALKHALMAATEAYLEKLDQITLADILQRPTNSATVSVLPRITPGSAPDLRVTQL